MADIQGHLRKTFLAGIFAAVPLAVTAFIIYWIDDKTRPIANKVIGYDVPIIGIVIAIAAIYVSGLIATSLIGKQILHSLDGLIKKVPFLSQVYGAWKQIALTPGGTEGVFSKVVLIPDETGQMHMMGFTSGRGIEGDPETLCVFVPQSPNPIAGRLYFVRRSRCRFLDVTTEEAFKIILSTGNYVPDRVVVGREDDKVTR